MFSRENFIEASRDFVCIRIETFENKEAEKKVRSLLNGRFANTAFCIFDPTGTKKLSRSGRSPGGLGKRGPEGRTIDESSVIREMKRISNRYKPLGENENKVLQDFNSLRQALNVASADQRLLVYVKSSRRDKDALEKLQKVMSSESVLGRFHVDFYDEKSDRDWKKKLAQEEIDGPAALVIHASKFGLDGVVVEEISLSESADAIKSKLIASNQKFAKEETRKSYSEHVAEGRRKRIYFENEIPYGEDRDGDGKIDKPQRRDRGRR